MTEAALRQALADHQAGRWSEAEAGYRAVLAADPDEADALALLGVVCEALGRRAEGLSCVERAIALDPGAALFRLYLGNMLAAGADWLGAAAAFEAAERLEPGRAIFPYNLGNVLREAGALHEAEAAYRRTLALAPDHAQARNNLALVFERRGDLAEARNILEETVARAPDYVDAWLNLSSVSERLGDYGRALAAATQARDLAPQSPRGWFGMGVAFSRMGRDEAALGPYQEALRLDPSWTEAWDNLGQTLQNLGRLGQARAAFLRCIACAGQMIEGEDDRRVDETEYGNRYWHLALLELLAGDLKRGFAHYRARFKELEGCAREPWPRPVWQGEDLRGKTILVMDEQGAGDALMMARYLPLLKTEKGAARVFFYVSPALAPLFEAGQAQRGPVPDLGPDLIVRKGQPIPDFDCYASIFDLPYGFGTTLETIPRPGAYVPRLPVHEALCAQEPEDTPRPLRVALVWAGAPLHKHDHKRSLPFSALIPLFGVQGVRFYSLTRDLRAGDAAGMAAQGVRDFSPLLTDFSASARLVAGMDLVISCDTSTAHLAGAMGTPVWTLLPFAPDWRWLLGREDSPWYPTMRLFRQTAPGDWGGVIERVRAALEDLRACQNPGTDGADYPT